MYKSSGGERKPQFRSALRGIGGFEEDWGEMRLERRARQIIDRYNR